MQYKGLAYFFYRDAIYLIPRNHQPPQVQILLYIYLVIPSLDA